MIRIRNITESKANQGNQPDTTYLFYRVGPESDFSLSGIRPDSWYYENWISNIRLDNAFLYQEKKIIVKNKEEKVLLIN